MRVEQFMKSVLYVCLIGLFAMPASAQLAVPIQIGPGLPEFATGTDYAIPTPELRWHPVANATWYRVWCDTTPVGGKPISKWVEGATSWKLPANQSLRKGQVYRWWVRAWSNQHGYGPWSVYRDFTVQDIKSVFLPASAFRPVSTFTSWQFVENGTMISSGGGSTADFVAALPVPDGIKIPKLTVHWKNNGSNSGTTQASVRFVYNVVGASWSLWNLADNNGQNGMASASIGTATAQALLFTSKDYHIVVNMSASNVNRYMLGVSIEYFE